MVSYQAWTKLVFDHVKSQGVTVDQDVSQQTISAAAEVWNREKDYLSTATTAEARDLAEDEVTVG